MAFSGTVVNGVIVLEGGMRLPEGVQVQVEVTLKSKTSRVDESYGLIGWTGDPTILRQIAEEDEFGVLESL
jgi:hypothetical protein